MPHPAGLARPRGRREGADRWLRPGGIAQIHEAGSAETELGSQPCFAMEYVEGAPITAWADERGIVHRDLEGMDVPRMLAVVSTEDAGQLIEAAVRILESAGPTFESQLAGTLANLAIVRVSHAADRRSPAHTLPRAREPTPGARALLRGTRSQRRH